MNRHRPVGVIPSEPEVRRQAADFDQFKAERFELCEYAVERSLIREHAREHGVVTGRVGVERRERGADDVAEATTNTDFVSLRSGFRFCTRHRHAASALSARAPASALEVTSLMMKPPAVTRPRQHLGHPRGDR